jgi:hypothetical protein
MAPAAAKLLVEEEDRRSFLEMSALVLVEEETFDGLHVVISGQNLYTANWLTVEAILLGLS